MRNAVVIGAGPAGLMAAETLVDQGVDVTVIEARPSVGRKFLMAGKSGLNLTKDEPFRDFLERYGEAADWLAPILGACSNHDVQQWARDLGQPVFTGSSGRVFPVAMKASPLLRAWLGRLGKKGVRLNTGWRWQGWQDAHLTFETSDKIQTLEAGATVLALGGASWARLGSDGAWAALLRALGVDIAPFQPANAGLTVDWSSHMARFFGQPIKATALHAGGATTRGEFVITRNGLEGGGIYAMTKNVREGATLTLDLAPDLDLAMLTQRLGRPRGKMSIANHLRKALKLAPPRLALLQEFAHPLPGDAAELARTIKTLVVRHQGLRPLDEAISTAGGIRRDAVTRSLMLRAIPGTFVAGEMLDWEAPTGGYLITACLATGRWAGLGAAQYLRV